jgi:hypothetical protein
MNELHIQQNKRYMRIGIGWCAFITAVCCFLIWRDGVRTEFVVGPVIALCVVITLLIRMKNNRPMMTITPKEFGGRLWGGRFFAWSDVKSIEFYTPGRFARTIRVQFPDQNRLIVFRYLQIHPDELMEILQTLASLPPQEREGFVKHVIDIKGGNELS